MVWFWTNHDMWITLLCYGTVTQMAWFWTNHDMWITLLCYGTGMVLVWYGMVWYGTVYRSKPTSSAFALRSLLWARFLLAHKFVRLLEARSKRTHLKNQTKVNAKRTRSYQTQSKRIKHKANATVRFEFGLKCLRVCFGFWINYFVFPRLRNLDSPQYTRDKQVRPSTMENQN